MSMAEALPERPSALQTQQQLVRLVLERGLPVLEGVPELEPAEGHSGVMGLVFNDDQMGHAVCRRVWDRLGDPGGGDTDFRDRSGLSLRTQQSAGVFTEGPLEIEGSLERAEALGRELRMRLMRLGHVGAHHVEYLGPEDPTWDAQNLVYTHAYRYPINRRLTEYEYWFTFGRAVGSVGNFREVATPALANTRTGRNWSAEHCKELAVNPRQLREGMKWVAMERAHLGYSTVAVARAPHDLNGPWEDLTIAIHPYYVAKQFREYYGDTNLSPKEQALQWAWIEDHVSPCAFVDIPDGVYGTHKGLQVAILSARSATTEDGKNGPFSIGIALFDPKTGSFPWIAPFPMLSQTARGIAFASYYNLATETLYWHEDDTIVHRGPLTQATILGQLPRESQVERYYQEALR